MKFIPRVFCLLSFQSQSCVPNRQDQNLSQIPAYIFGSPVIQRILEGWFLMVWDYEIFWLYLREKSLIQYIGCKYTLV